MTPLQKKILAAFDETVGSGVALSFDEILAQHDLPSTDKLDTTTLDLLDDNFFTCQLCDWTMPVDEMCDEGDDCICQECSNG